MMRAVGRCPARYHPGQDATKDHPAALLREATLIPQPEDDMRRYLDRDSKLRNELQVHLTEML
jgi:hypothetical protein